MINFNDEIINALSDQATSKILNKFNSLLQDSNPIYLVGRNDQSLELAKRFKISGIIDDTQESNLLWNGLEIFRSENINRNSLIVNCATSISPVLVEKNLRLAGFQKIINITDLISEKGEVLSLPWFVLQQRAEIGMHFSWWNSMFSMMSDQTSKDVLLDTLRFRLTANPKYMLNYKVRLNEQYFEDFMNYDQEVFIDAGAFDGDTTAEFINRVPNYKKIYLYEPSPKNILEAKKRLIGIRDLVFRSVGLSNQKGKLFFNIDAGSASAITSENGEYINVVSLSEESFDEKITLIKMDLEGWELNALCGAKEIIRMYRPKMAIAVYHAAKDFREIPEYILAINPNYKLYLRHYSQGWSETIMYFV